MFLCNVEHVERHDAGNAEFQQLQRQVEVALEIGGVDHVDQQIRVAAQNVVAGNLLIERGLRRNGGQGIGAGKVNQSDLMIRCRELAFFTFNGYACPVTDALARARELVK